MAAAQGSDSEDEGEPFFCRMTPMEFDIQLQGAELVFRSLLEGKRIGRSPHEDIEDWNREVLGDEWCAENAKQRQALLQKMREDGENSPAWSESLAHMGDIAWEVFEGTNKGEKVRKLDVIDRLEIIEQFKDLRSKVRISHYARCGAGDRMYGFRACIAIMRVFIRDAEILEYCSEVLKYCITDIECSSFNFRYNRDGLATLTLPYPPPAERHETDKDRGWSFFRAALDAFMVQAGDEPFGQGEPEEKGTMEIEGKVVVYREARKEVALKIAETLLAVKEAPPFLAQCGLLREETPQNATRDQVELKAMLPHALEKVEAMIAEEPSEVLSELKELLLSAGAGMATQKKIGDTTSEGSGGSGGSQGGGIRGLLAGKVKGLLGRSGS